MEKKFVHPYIPNSVPEVQQAMLKEIGVERIEDLYNQIPESLRFSGKLNLPDPLLSELELKRHVERILQKNRTCSENINFLGGGCARHYVPAICDEINHRSEFLTAYAGEPYEDHGRFQALFEYESLMAELLDVDVVNVPTFDWAQAASTSIRMAGRITNRDEAIIAGPVSPERLAVIRNYCEPVMKLTFGGYHPETGLIDLQELQNQMNSDVAGVYFENPSFYGVIQTQGQAISDLAHRHGALSLVGVDPITLGVLAPPDHYGADIACGDIQPLGLHMNFGGATGGFIATRDEEKFVSEYPSRLFGITKTSVKDEYGFGDVLYDRTSFGDRVHGKEFVGTAAALWGITAAVYLSMMGPKGMQELGQHIMQKSRYAMKKMDQIPGVKAPRFQTVHFKEFVVDFNATGKTVKEINHQLLERHIFGGKDLSDDFPQLGQSALYSITEMNTKEDIDRLVEELRQICVK